MSVLLDSNILIDHLRDVPAATETIRRHRHVSVSVISRIEVLAGPAAQVEDARLLLSTMQVLPLTEAVADKAVEMRRELRLRLPDAVILATAKVHRLTLVTRDQRDFGGLVDVDVPYRL